jgi:hypothetical protein
MPMPIPANKSKVVTITETCIEEPCLIGMFVLATFGSFILKKKFPKPADKPWLIA